MAEKKPSGLEDVVVCEQDICFIDGQRGQLVYRGYALGFRGDRIAGASPPTVTVSGLVVTHHPRTDFRRPPSSYYLRSARHRTPRRASIDWGVAQWQSARLLIEWLVVRLHPPQLSGAPVPRRGAGASSFSSPRLPVPAAAF